MRALFTAYRRARRTKRYKKAFTLIELMIVLGVSGSLSALGITKYEGFVCHTQQQEARATLQEIFQVESALFAETGVYALMQSCTFGYGPPVCSNNFITITFPGRSRFTYSVPTADTVPNTPNAGFIAEADGNAGKVVGSILKIDQNGALQVEASVCE